MLIYLSCPPPKKSLAQLFFKKRPKCIPLASGSLGDLVSASGKGRTCLMVAGSQHPLSTDPGAWIPAQALFLLERRGWEAEMRLGSWENSVSGFITSRTTENGACAKHRGVGDAGESECSGHRDSLLCTTWRTQGPVPGFKDVRDSSGVF